MGKSTISMAIFNSYVKLPEGIHIPSFPETTRQFPPLLDETRGSLTLPKKLEITRLTIGLVVDISRVSWACKPTNTWQWINTYICVDIDYTSSSFFYIHLPAMLMFTKGRVGVFHNIPILGYLGSHLNWPDIGGTLCPLC